MSMDEITWTCEGCTPALTLDHEAFVVHAGKVHGLLEGATGKREMIRHGDGAKSFFTTYRWHFDGFTATQKITSQRTGRDAAFWEAMGGP